MFNSLTPSQSFEGPRPKSEASNKAALDKDFLAFRSRAMIPLGTQKRLFFLLGIRLKEKGGRAFPFRLAVHFVEESAGCFATVFS